MEKLTYLEENSNSKDQIRTWSENLKSFTFEDYSKFFQVLANYQYLSTLDSNSLSAKNKDIVLIDDKQINYDENELDLNSDNENKNTNNIFKCTDINKVIKRKEIPIKTLIKDSGIDTKIDENQLVKQSSMNDGSISFKSFFEDLIKNMKKNAGNNNINSLKNMIKIYARYIYHNKIIKFEKEDRLLLDFIIENYSDMFYPISKYWLYNEFLLNEESRRYDTLLNEIISRVDLQKSFFGADLCKNEWVDFVSHLPKYSEKSLEHVFKVLKDIVENYKKSKELGLVEKIFTVMKDIYNKLNNNIYYKTSNVKYMADLTDQILRKFLETTKIPDISLINDTLKFLRDNIYNDNVAQKFKDFAINQFLELKTIKEENTDILYSKYATFIWLCRQDNELIKFIPEVYSESNPFVKDILDKKLHFIIKKLKGPGLIELVSRCSNECVNLVMDVINNMNMIENVNIPKLINKIKNFYERTEDKNVEVLVSLSEQLSTKEFFESFIWDKFKKYDSMNMIDNNIKIFQKINENKNENLLENSFFKFETAPSDKIIGYILYYLFHAQSSNYNNSVLFSDFNLLLKYYKLLKTELYIENFNTFFDKILSFKEGFYLYLVNITYENFKDVKEIKSLLLSILYIYLF